MVRDMTRPLRVAAAHDSDGRASDGLSAHAPALKVESSADTHADTTLSPGRADSSPSVNADAREQERDLGEQGEVEEEREENEGEGESTPRSVDGDASQDVDERLQLRERLKQERLQ